MIFRVIEGGIGSQALADGDAGKRGVFGKDDVLHEAERRIRATGYETWRNRETLTGVPVPRDLSYLAMQIRFAAEAIGKLADIPVDFRSDIYWPA